MISAFAKGKRAMENISGVSSRGPQRIRRFGYLGNRNLELRRRSLPPKVGHFSLSEAARVVGAASAGAPGCRLIDAQALSINYGAVANERRA
jgi:hypothetical protein